MRKMLAIAAAVAMSSTLLVGCGDQEPAVTGPDDSAQAGEQVLSGSGDRVAVTPVGPLPAGKAAAAGGPVGFYWVNDGPSWPTNTHPRSCVEACAEVFGGQASDYACSTSPTEVNNQAWASAWGSPDHCKGHGGQPVAEDYKVGTGTNCGGYKCYVSAYVQDWCFVGSDNYCYLKGPQTKDDCKNGGWEQYGFKNQGQCVRFIETGKDSR